MVLMNLELLFFSLQKVCKVIKRAIVILWFLFYSNHLLAIDYTWADGTVSGPWSNPALWSPGGGPPGAADNASIAFTSNAGCNLTIGTDAVTNFTFTGAVSSGSTFLQTTAGSLAVSNGGTITSTFGTSVGGSSTYLNDFPITSTNLLNFTGDSNIILNGNITGASGGRVTKTGTNELRFNGTNTYTGVTTISAGTLVINGAITSAYAGGIVNNSALQINPPTNSTYGQIISGTGSLTKLGSNSLNLTAANSYQGGTIIGAGAITLSGSGTIGATTGTLNMSSGATLTLATGLGARTIGGLFGFGGTIALNDNNFTITQGSDATFDGSISGTGGLTKTGAATLTFSQAQTYTGTTTLSTGTLGLESSGSLAGALVMSGGTQLTASPGAIGSLSGSGTISGSGALVITQTVNGTFSGVITGSFGGISKAGAATLTLSGANDYGFGGTTINAGEIILTGSGAIGNTDAQLLMNAGTLTLTAGIGARSIGSLSGASGATIALNDNTLTTNVNSNSTFDGLITGTGGLTKSGSQSLTLSGNNSYSGATTISQGTLIITASTTSRYAGGFVDNAALQISPPSDCTYAGVISGTGTLTKGGANNLILTNTNTYTGATTISAGTLTLSGSSSTLGGSPTFSALTINGGSFVLEAGAGNKTIRSLSGSSGTTINLNENTLSLSTATTTTYNGVISGTGGLTLPNNYSLTLGGANDYTGTTTINSGATLTLSGSGSALSNSTPVVMVTDGRLQLASGAGNKTIGNLSGTGRIFLNGNTLTINQTGTTTFSLFLTNQITNGVLVKAGAGSLTMNGLPTGTGIGTTISAGTLTLTLGSACPITNNATFVFSSSSNLTLSGLISGTGTFTKNGTGTLTLSVANDYSGLTTVSAGTLTFTASTASMTGLMTNNSAVIFNQSTDSAFNQAISGTGTLTKSGAGNLTLAGVNDYSGLTTISAGTLTFTASTSSMSGLITNNSAVVFNQSTASTFGQVISGTGTLTKSGAGVLTLSAANNYTGSNTLSAGGITLTGSGTIGATTNSLVINGGTLTLSSGIGSRTITGLSGSGGTIALNDNPLTLIQGSDATYAGVFTGGASANILKQGAGMLTLTGTSSGFLGDTTIDAGTIAINGTLNGETTVNASGRLQGVGTLDDLRNLGTVSPGNSIGTLTITGDFTVADPAAILEIEIDPDGTSDKLAITGTADLDGYVELLPHAGVYMGGQQFLILTAGSITNDFLGIVEAFPQDFQFLRLGNSIYIVVDNSFIVSPYASLLNGNALLTYNYLFCVDGNDPDLLEIQNTLLALPTLQALSDALVQLCPALYSSLPLLELQNNVHMARVMTQKSRKYFCDCNHMKKKKYPEYPLTSFWVQPIGFYYNQKGVQNQYGFHDYTYGMASGFLLPMPSGLLLDLGLGYTHSELKWNNSRGRADANTIYFAPSLSFWFEPFCISLIVQGDVNFYNTKRNIEFTGVSETAKGNFESYDILCGLDFSAKIELLENLYQDHSTPFYIEPSMQFYCMNFFQQRFVEKDGGDLNLSVGHKHTVFLQPNLGLKITQEIRTKSLCFAPNLYVGYLANIPLKNAGYNSSIPEFNIPCFSDFTVYGYHRVTNQLLLGAEFVIKKCDRFLITAGYNATMFSHLFTQGVNARFSLEF